MPLINELQIKNVSAHISKIPVKPLNVFDTSFYPSVNELVDRVLAYFIVMVAMDHRLSRPGRPYEAFIDGRLYRGADLLYYLGARKFEADPEFFSPERLVFITKNDVIEWLSVDNNVPPDPELRADLLNDIGTKSIKLFNGDFTKLLKISGGFLRKKNGYGLQDLLKIFKAYQDPVEKKSYLLIKFLIHRGLFKPLDEENLNVAVDNHLTRVAIRLGLIELEEKLIDKISNKMEVSHDEDIIVRLCVREAYKMLSKLSNTDILLLDDILWVFGRSVCARDDPKCYECVFRDLCKAHRNGVYLTEHVFIDTWYY
ncbi:MAG: iron-sulfur cluster loop [Ignisphaera sp.]|nr:iron-sulfur cluster loop [Ignisphaera sp.]MCX8167486.1 iron-sulfur cluster loop [Ignisphaera sp.]MDW8084650.1 iron-sulfur cluster loop [Ignisphaera sp.]